MFTGSEDGSIKIWDLRAPGCQREFESGCAINTVELMPSQGEVVSGDRQGSIRCWDLGQNSCSDELGPDGTEPIRSLSVARDGSMLAAANDQGTCFLWRLGRGGARANPENSESPCRSSRRARARRPRRLQRMAQTPDMPPSPQAHATYLIKCPLFARRHKASNHVVRPKHQDLEHPQPTSSARRRSMDTSDGCGTQCSRPTRPIS